MRSLFLTILFVLFLSSLLSQQEGTGNALWEKDLKKANELYLLTEPTTETDSLALNLFIEVAGKIPQGGIQDSIAADCFAKAANIHQGYQRFIEASIQYHQALERGAMFAGIRYTSWLNLGSNHYFSFRIDSAQLYFEKASELADTLKAKGRTLPELDVLYNSLGAIYFESANYNQAQNYFEQARQYISKDAPEYRDLITGIENNIANCYMKRHRFDTALFILRSLAPSPNQQEIIRQNMAHVLFEQGKYDSALAIYNTLNPLSGFNRIVALNNIARIFMARGDWPRAEKVFDSSLSEIRKEAAGIRNKEEALAYLYRSRLADVQGLTDEALTWINEGLKEIHLDFKPRYWRENPEDITRSVSPVTLFQLLKEKAELLFRKYRKSGQEEFLIASLETYRKTMQTGRFIRLNFDNDEAKLLFNESNRSLFSGAIAAAFESGERGRKYEDDFLYMLENYKGTILNQHLQHVELKTQAKVPEATRRKEKELKQLLAFYISRLNRSGGEADAQRLEGELLKTQVELSRLQRTYDVDPTFQLFRNQQVQEDHTVANVQNKLPRATVLLHYYADDSVFYAMAISPGKVKTARIGEGQQLQEDLFSFLRSLNDQTEGQRFMAREKAISLYRQLIEPVLSVLEKGEQWMIIPDGPLFYLPFEALMKGKDNSDYLVSSKTIAYHYSVDLLLEKNIHHETGWDTARALGLAPFSGVTDTTLFRNWKPLPYAQEELHPLFNNFIGEKATKQRFLEESPQHSLLHLATHASLGADSSDTFIQFFPTDSSLPNQRLYLPEIYDLDLRHTRLVILSACETGGGRSLSGEGLASLSRAFLYAGAEGIMATLWKTEDRVASYLMKRMHEYIKQGSSPAKALQKAKRDLLKDPAVDPRFKTPNYWANFIYVGKLEKSEAKPDWVRYGLFGAGLILFVFIFWRFWFRRQLA